MTEQQTAAPANRLWLMALALACYLLAQCVWRAFIPAHEYPGRPGQIVEMGIDALAVVGLILLRKLMPPVLFWTGLIAGLTLFAFRLSSDAAWWTGHLMYAPR